MPKFIEDFFSPKQLLSIRESNAPINVWEGSVSAGKTYASMWRFYREASHGPEGQYGILTKTYDTFKRNIVPLLEDMLGPHMKYFSGKRELYLKDKLIHVIGCSDERAEHKIRGTTFGGAYVDEATLIPESAFKMLQSRLRVPNAKLFCTTNPDSPYHWFKKEILEGNSDVKSWQFLMEDNPFITEDYKDYLKRQYKGLWYQRYILGQWVQADGAVYEYFDEKIHIIDYPQSRSLSYIVGVDYGTINPCAFVLIGYNPHSYPNMWVEDEYYYNSRQKQRQKTDGELADDFQKFIEGKPITAIYIDPSAASFRAELIKRGIDQIADANNDVNNGIGFVGMQLNNGSLKICRKCQNLIQEFVSYVWDEKAAKHGVEKPKKENDHALDALRYAIFTHFFGQSGEPLTPQELEKRWRETHQLGPDLPPMFRPINETYRF